MVTDRNLQEWASRGLTELRLESQATEPTRPRDGVIAYANGSDWNPSGTGAGIYWYGLGSWYRLATGAGIPLVDGDKGDVVVSATGLTWTIDSNAVTFAKMQNIATDKLIGRATAGSGDPEEITCTSAGRALLDDANALAQRTTLGVGVGDSPAFQSLVLGKESTAYVKVDTTAPTFGWRDLIGKIETRTGGSGVPTFSSYLGNLYQFSMGTAVGVKEVFIEYHVPHDWAILGSGCDEEAYIHIHTSVITAPGGGTDVGDWLFEIAYASGYDTDVFEGTAGSANTVTVGVTQTYATAYRHYIAEVLFANDGGLVNPGTGTFSITAADTTLTASASTFSAADIGKTVRVVGAGAAGADLDTNIASYTSATEVELTDAASTTVTAADAFRWRILDYGRIEIDGLVLVRCWRNAARTSDSLNVAPFVHFVDVHYQSTGIMGTKDKNTPFYT